MDETSIPLLTLFMRLSTLCVAYFRLGYPTQPQTKAFENQASRQPYPRDDRSGNTYTGLFDQ